MSFSQDELQSLIEKVEISQAKARRRTIIAVLVPTVAAILYLGFTIWLINLKQSELRDVETKLDARKGDLTQVEQKISELQNQRKKLETTLTEQNQKIRQVEDQLNRGNVAAAQEQIANIGTDQVRQKEISGFRYILKGNLEDARRSFEEVYKAYPSYHNVFEIYTKILTQNRIREYNGASSTEKQEIQREVINAECKINDIAVELYNKAISDPTEMNK
jgi:DNA repair exonuclease SbcCD ATPase subunit